MPEQCNTSIPQPNNLPEGLKQTELGPLPKDWEVVRLGEVVIPKYGKAKPNATGNVAVMGSGGTYGWTDEPLVDFPTIIIGRKGAAGEVWLAETPCWPSDTTFYFQWKKHVETKYLYYLLKLYKPSGEYAKTTLPSLQRHELENLVIPLPPFSEQQKIAKVLSTVQQAIEVQDKIISATRGLKNSLMRHLFTYGPVPVDQVDKISLKETEIGPMPEHWEVVRLGEVAKTASGGTPNRTNQEYYGGFIPWIKSGELNDSLVSKTEETITEMGLANSTAKVLPAGTLLVAMYGATAGKVGISTIDSATNQAVCAIFPSEKARSEYLFYAVIYRRNELLSERYGGAQPNISQTVLRAFRVHFPPLSEQSKIAQVLSAVDEKIEKEEKKKRALEGLFKSLLSNLMTGKIRVNKLEIGI